MNIKQQWQINLWLMIAQSIGVFASLISFTIDNWKGYINGPLAVALILLIGLIVTYRRYHFTFIPYINVLLATIFVSFFFIRPEIQTTISTVLFIPTVLSVVILSSSAILPIGILTYLFISFRAPAESPYLQIHHILSYIIILVCLYIGRKRIEIGLTEMDQARIAAESVRDQLQEQAQQLQAQSEDLAQANQEQAQLLDLLQTLELPLVYLGNQSVLVPLIGNLDSNRLAPINQRILDTINKNRIQNIIFDLSGIEEIEPEMITTLKQTIAAIRLQGSNVVISGLSATTATNLAQQGINISNVDMVRSPYEAFEHLEIH